MKHALVVYDPATGKEIVSIPLTTEMFWAIAATIEPEEDDHHDMVACYEVPLNFFLEPDTE